MAKTIIVMGDVNGDGRVNIEDCHLAYLAAQGHITLSGNSKTAADIDGDGTVSMNDFIAITDHVYCRSMITSTIEI